MGHSHIQTQTALFKKFIDPGDKNFWRNFEFFVTQDLARLLGKHAMNKRRFTVRYGETNNSVAIPAFTYGHSIFLLFIMPSRGV